jgi:hypothetical protein
MEFIEWVHFFIKHSLFFFFIISGDVMRNDLNYFKEQRKLNRPIYKQVRLELILMILIDIILIYFNIYKFIFLIYIPQLYAKWGITSMNLLQHDGCAMTSHEGNILNQSKEMESIIHQEILFIHL